MRLAVLALSFLLLSPFAALSSSPQFGEAARGPALVNMRVPEGVVRRPGDLLVGIDGAGKRSVISGVEGVELVDSPALERLGIARVSVRPESDETETVARLAATPGVRFVEPNIVIQPASVPSDPLYAGVNAEPTDLQKWVFGGLPDNPMLNAEAAWDGTLGDESVVIAVLDSGLNPGNSTSSGCGRIPARRPEMASTTTATGTSTTFTATISTIDEVTSLRTSETVRTTTSMASRTTRLHGTSSASIVRRPTTGPAWSAELPDARS
ncbi:MAG: hypothetical protein IPF53_18635 [Blastocatellia bacterium]|nr:hypothetical protein [Blastocatellia bacterium]